MSKSSAPYNTLLQKILNDGKATIVLLNKDHLARLRAGLSTARKTQLSVAEFTGDYRLGDKQFKYSQDEDDPARITISLEPKDTIKFQIVEPQ